MNLQEFASHCADIIETKFEDVSCVEITRVIKNNGVSLNALQIKKTNNNMAPTIYIDDYYKMYQDGAAFDEVMSMMLDVYLRSLSAKEPDISFFEKFDTVKDNLLCKVINHEKNIELLNNVPHVDCLDLSIVFYVVLTLSDGERGTILIRNEHFKSWNVDLGDIYEAALDNTINKQGTYIWNIEDVILDMMQKGIRGDASSEVEYDRNLEHIKDNPMYVMSNKSKCFGAASMLDIKTLELFSKRINSPFYIIPSSIHELILVPDNEDIELPMQLLEMVKEVNKSEVGPDEYLANSVYRFDPKVKKVTLCV